LAICGLPPFNGFISEFLIFQGLFKGLKSGGLTTDLTILGSFIGLALIGGLAIFCFTKVFSIVFLGTARTEAPRHAQEVDTTMLISMVAVGVVIVGIGILPGLFVGPVTRVTQIFTGVNPGITDATATLSNVALGSLLFIGFATALWIVKMIHQKKVAVVSGPTWGCGYAGADPARHQYTATSYAENYIEIVGAVANISKKYESIPEGEIFASPRKFETHGTDFLEDNLVNRPVGLLTYVLEKSAILQTGKLQHYVLYGLLFLVTVFLLTFFKLI
jgi:NADH:ubiquinone oxidoreductase subunit 5 (subunit L)/multisubunit Na+/H+ antiporter MnhA subunit